ncbi:MAG: helix-turn-helix transcriptional regulator [Clostridia bacterium]|nr:helix-turn-helix transcriptional regulator [Clostridia bacterium]MBR2908651.1 helix-turn-helix transcriptional regulator [Clostridia bacterium]
MIRYLSFTALRKELAFSEVIECHKQIWAHGSEWKKYERTPRFADGLIFVCSKVRAVFTVEGGSTLTAEQGDLLYLPEGARYSVRFLGGGHGTDLYTVNFRLKDRNGNVLRFGDQLTRLANGAPDSTYTIASRLADTCCSPEENTLRKHSELFALFDAIGEEINYRSSDYYPIRKGARLLVKEWNQNRPIAYYAELSGVSETSFYQHFKAWASSSPAEYRTKMRISAAKSLLRNSSYRISEIAAEVGFDDPYYFSRIFRKAVGVSPRAYRQSDKTDQERDEKPT